MSSFLLIKLLACIAIFTAIFLFVISLKGIKDDIPEEERVYMDPLPKNYRYIWWMVKIFAYYIGERMPVDTLEKIKSKLQRSGMSFIMTPDQYVGLKITSAILTVLAILVFQSTLESFQWKYLIAAAIVGFFLPNIQLNDKKKEREKKISKALPVYLDYLTMAVQAGMNLSGAMQQAVSKGPDGPLKVEFEKVLRDIRAGMPRNDAIRAMAERTDMSDVRAFASTVIQAERTGASVGESLKVQADQRRIERFQRAEKLAMEAPVKLIFPLVVFIFPMTFLVILFPLVMRFVHNL